MTKRRFCSLASKYHLEISVYGSLSSISRFQAVFQTILLTLKHNIIPSSTCMFYVHLHMVEEDQIAQKDLNQAFIFSLISQCKKCNECLKKHADE